MSGSAFDQAPVVILSSIDWDTAWQRHHIFAERFAAAGHRVFFVENTGFREPRAADSRRLWRKLVNLYRPQAVSRVNAIPAGISIVAPLVLPPTRASFRRLDEQFLIPQVLGALRSAGLDHAPIVIAYMPTTTVVELAKQLSPAALVYDCASNFRGHPDAVADLPEIEGRLMRAADLVVCDSDFLFQQKKAEHARVVQIHQGVSEDFFAAAPARGCTRFGYYGTWIADLDHRYLNALAAAGFEASFSGFIKCAQPPFSPAVRLLGPVARERLVERLEQFDAFILPHRINEFMRGVVPAKLYEMLAMGRPIIAAPLPSLLPLERDGLLYIARTPEEAVAVAQALPRTETPELRARRVARAREHTHAREFARLEAEITSVFRPGPWSPPALSPWATGPARLFLKGMAFVGSLYGLAKLAALVTQAVAGRLLGPEAYGRAHLVLAASAFAQILPMLGFPVAIGKMIPEDASEEQKSALVSTALLLFAGWAGASAAALWAIRAPLGRLLGVPPPLLTLAIILALMTAVHTVVSSPLLGLHRFGERGVTEAVYGFATPALLVVFALRRVDESALIGALCAALACSTIFALYALRRHLRPAFDSKAAVKLLTHGTLASINLLAAACVVAPARLLLHGHFSPREVGVFSAYFTATSQLSLALITMIGAVAVPVAASEDGQAQAWRWLRAATGPWLLAAPLAFAALGAVGLAAFGRQYPLRLDWLLLFGLGASLILLQGAAAALLAARDLRTLGRSAAGSLVAGAANLALSIYLVPRYGIPGAAGALALAYVLALGCYAGNWYPKAPR